MKMKNLVAFAMLALGAVAAPFAGRAEVSGGDIYSVDLSTKFNGVIPSPGTTLTIGEKVTVRLRLVNRDEGSTGKPTAWSFVPTSTLAGADPQTSVFAPQLGLMLGGQQVFADYLGNEQVPIGTDKRNNFTDLYFQYQVKSGDLALPARFMSIEGTGVSDDNDSTDYAIQYCNFYGNYWKLSNNNGDACIVHFCDENLSPDPDPSYEAGKPQRFITGTALGISIKTVDFDTEYFKEPSMPGVDDGIWRQLYVGLTTALPSLPTIKVDGLQADVDATMYVWVDNVDNDDPVAQVLASDNPEKIVDPKDPTKYRWVIKVPVARGVSSATFRLQGVKEGEVKVRMSSSRELSYNKAGDLIEDWVERRVSVVPAPDPFVMVETLNPKGEAQTEFNCTENYKDFVGKFKITLSLPPTNKVTVTLTPDWADVIPEAVDQRRIAISKSGDKADMPWLDRDLSVDFEAGQTVQTLYIYALDRTTDHKGKITFNPSVSDTDLYTGTPVGGSLVVNAATPVVLRPESGEELDTAILKEPYTLFFEVTDGYRCMNTNKGWKIEYKCSAVGDTKSHTVSADMESGTGMLTADIKFTKQCVGEKFQARVKDPNGVYSAWRTYTVTVEEGCSVKVTYDRTGSYAENSAATAKLTFELSQTSGDDLYLFLEPVNEAASNHVETAQLAKDGSRNGIEVPAGETQGRGEANITLLDGGYGSDYNPKFKIVVCNAEEYSADAVQSNWAGSCSISITNVIPRITVASVGGDDVANGGVSAAVAQGVKKVFTVSVNEPGTKDKEATGDDAFLTQWKFGASNWVDMKGNPDSKAVTNEFGSSGDQVVKVRCQDKDMRKLGLWSEEFTFTVPVMDTPKVVITPVQDKKQYYEDETGSDYGFNVTLTIPPYLTNNTQRLNVLIKKELLGDAGQYSVDDLVLSKTNVTFTANKTDVQSFYLKQLDGTMESASAGFRIVAEVANDGPGGVDGDGKTWDNGEIEVYILNREPKIRLPGEQLVKDDKPVPTPTAVGKENKLIWSIEDVIADTNRMTVTFMTNEGEEWTYTAGDNVASAMKGTNTWTFSSSGEKSITMTATDKDGGSVSRTWYYTIEASKTLELVPHGPPSGNGTPLSSRYQDKAAGLGAGKVWAKNLSSIEDWVFGFNCGLESDWRIYAAGYTNGEHDVRSNPDFDYTYTDADGRDSFLYAWLQIAKERDAAKPTDTYLAVVPEHRNVANSGTLINLPSAADENGGYAKTSAEAIFSKEFLPSDNMGDINQDGIPDIYAKKYGFGVFDESGNVVGDDLAKITSENKGNDDKDFLPTTGFSAYSTLIPGLPETWQALGTPFAAKTEIRGYGEALNDAPLKPWIGISDVKPERRYTDPRTDPRSTLDGLSNGEPVEYYAWLAYAATHGIADPTNEANKAAWELWSPECPSDPTLADTDDDGFTDGYEYYFWYRAHVGYVENGVHKYLTGRAYDPRNPGEGRFISREEIETLMHPGVAYAGEDAKTRDTDNDGLPDLLEFEIGTNPFDFDTDGDGLPDGFEIMLGGTSPLLASSVTGISDAMRNYDGDAMAFTTPFNEVSGFVIPPPQTPLVLNSWAVIDPHGDTDGVQWYVSKSAPTNIVAEAADTVGSSFTLAGDTNVFVTTLADVPVVDGRLAIDLTKDILREAVALESLTNAFPALTNLIEIVEGEPDPETGDPTATTNKTDYIALMPVLIRAGTPVTNVTTGVKFRALTLADEVKDVNTAWVYGRRGISQETELAEFSHFEGFGMLTVGRYGGSAAGAVLAALPKEDDSVALIHNLVYQEFGFDPRTAWNATTPLAPRWGSTADRIDGFDEEGTEQKDTELMLNNYNSNIGVSTRTRDYTLYDEFLLLSFFLNTGVLADADVTPTQTTPWYKIWSRYTTNGQGPFEPMWSTDEKQYKGRSVPDTGVQMTDEERQNGADTDQDGVPDGWELYVMSGPKGEDGKYVFSEPFCAMGPFKPYAGSKQYTDNQAFGQDADGLTELAEFAGTDSCAYYSKPWNGNEKPYSTTIKRPEEHEKWINKFMPTDPWNEDTDGDGLGDDESKVFKYGTPVDDGKTHCAAGGGGNPLSVDTDMDGLPDPWENQFKGTLMYNGPGVQYQKDADGNLGNPLQGLCNGMDGSVWDAYNSPYIYTSSSSNSMETLIVTLNGVAQVVDRDYDHDGLENWQEYMTGAMRVWRYDDPVTTWDYIPYDCYFDLFGNFAPDLDALAQIAGVPIPDMDTLLYYTLFDPSSPIYNPHFVTDATPCSQYFSRVKNGWDLVYSDFGSYYMLPDNLNGVAYADLWGYMGSNVKKYICTSPIKADTDQDGMDDGYELFHGMNPLLGEAGILESTRHPCDIVFDAWYNGAFSPAGDALQNVWRPMGTEPYDFVDYPWLNGLVAADPDGDDIRNQNESIMPLVAPSTVWYHTDPTPLWMTDSSYDQSLVRRFFRMPVCFNVVLINLGGREVVRFGDEEYPLGDCDGFGHVQGMPAILPFNPDYYSVAHPDYMNWMYSFEENEGYDTDHDATSDYEELQGKFRGKTDPQDADSPRRRQAMYFQGPSNPSALQSMPFAHERHPRQATSYPDDMSLLQYTVEAWVRPETTADATVIERASWTSPTHVADEQYLRCNFRIAIRNGKWYTMFDSNGTLAFQQVEVEGSRDVKPNEWTYVAATYDAKKLTLYVNGEIDGYTASSVTPEYGSSAVVLYPGDGYMAVSNDWVQGATIEESFGNPHNYWFDREYDLHAFVLGASFKSDVDPGGGSSRHLNVMNGAGWKLYKDFFTGYVDEVRVWDGAQDADAIAANYLNRKRYTREDALENRSAFYKQWLRGERRYSKDLNGADCNPVPELRFHWTFDSIPGAENPRQVELAPHGFLTGAKAPWSSPADYEIAWWRSIVGGYGSVYGGLLNWVTWIPNTVTHLPRFDGSTLDSSYWSENFAGNTSGSFKFARTAEPVSRWTQYGRNLTVSSAEFYTTPRRFWQMHTTGTNVTTTLPAQFSFTGRHLNQLGDDLLPLGGAFVKYVDSMWDDMGASATWEHTGTDIDNDGLPDWWQEYADQNYREGLDPFKAITWDTPIAYEIGGVVNWIPANEAYKRDLAKGMYVDRNGQVHPTLDERDAGIDSTPYKQTAKSDKMIPDWWKTLRKIDNEPPFDDTDHDGLNNYVEYVASELMPFRLQLDPLNPKTQDGVLDYFRRPFDGASKLYLGEMLTDHDQMEDHWERSLGDTTVANASIWDALKDADEDGWNNFAENRYNGYTMSTLAQLISHAVGDTEALDAPVPSIKVGVRYNGDRALSAGTTGTKTEGEGQSSSETLPALVVQGFSRGESGDYVLKPDAVWTVTPGVKVDKEVYLGGWEDRTVRGTMAPGNIDIGNAKLMFAQVPQSDLYSWTDETGIHISEPYSAFKAALEKNPDIIQNVQNFTWNEFVPPANEYTSSDKAVTINRDALTQNGYIAVYGERVGTIDLTTGDFEFDMGMMTRLTGLIGTYDDSPAGAWGFKEAIFKITYSATVPALQQKVTPISLALPDKGFVRSGLNSFTAFYDLDGSGTWDPGEPFGVVNDVEVGWASRSIEIELTDTSAVTPRVKLWGAGGEGGTSSSSGGGKGEKAEGRAAAEDSDRGVIVGTATFEAGDDARFEVATAPAPKSRVRVVRYKVDKFPVYKVGVDAGVVLEKDFMEESRDFLHEGDFLVDGDFDIDWKNLYTDVVNWQGAQMAACEVTNVTYLIIYNWDKSEYISDKDTNTQVKANATLVTRRFEQTRSVPTASKVTSVYTQSRPTFSWRIDNEDKWASWFGTTYTAFKLRVKDLSGNLVYDSGIRRLPAKDSTGAYSWKAPLYVGETVPETGVVFKNLTEYTWEVAVYNAKFKTDTLMAMETQGNPFSRPETFRMNVTAIDASSEKLAVRVCYVGPAQNLLDKIRVQAFSSPDFTGDPVAESTLRYVDAKDSLSPLGPDANAEVFGLPKGRYFLRAYIDTNGNGVHDDWESWGYLNERDRASKAGIFNPVSLETSLEPPLSGVRKLFIEDCDTDGDWFPDVWEAEQNGNVFDRTKIAPVTGDAELIGANPQLSKTLNMSEFPMLEALFSRSGLALLSGVPPTKVRVIENSDGTLGIQVENKVETVKVTSMDFDANGNIEIKVAAATAPVGMDADMAKLFNAKLVTQKTVTCTVYRRASLAAKDGWTKAGSQVITIGNDEATPITVSGGKAGQGFYKVVIEE